MPQTPDEQKAIVQRMIDAGESEDNIATVIQHFKTTSPETAASHTQSDPKRAALDAAAAKESKKPGQFVNALPAIGGAVGGILGGAGGTAFGMGVGGVPGAVGGAAIGGAGGEALKQNINRLTGQSAPSTPGEAFSDIATEGAIQGGTELVGGAVAPVASHLAGVLMQSAVKPGIKATARALGRGVSGTDLPIVRTLLNEGVNVSPGGIAKLNDIMAATNAEVKAAVNNLPGTVYPTDVATRTRGVRTQAANQVNPTADVKSVEKGTREFLTQPGTTQTVQTGTKQVPVRNAQGQIVGMQTVPVTRRLPRGLSLAEAQEMKMGTYKSLGDKAYGELKAPAIETQKALARGLKEEIEAEALRSGVDLAALNAREGAAIAAKEAIATRIAAAGNRDPIALAWLAHNPTQGLLFIMERSPAVKSMLARGLYQSAEKASGVPQNVIRLLVQSLATSGGSDMTPSASHEQGAQ